MSRFQLNSLKKSAIFCATIMQISNDYVLIWVVLQSTQLHCMTTL